MVQLHYQTYKWGIAKEECDLNALDRNREAFAATGITVTGLPERYINDHPENICSKFTNFLIPEPQQLFSSVVVI